MKPELSLAMIFRNDAQYLERCLKSIRLLDGQISYEIVMADTGSADGSREIAARYADVLFDFPWVNDFSAARNAVLARCSGRWALTIDTDEWFAGTQEELAEFLQGEDSEKYDFAAVVQRNYQTADLETYSDILVARMMRMAKNPHYIGVIHEVTYTPEGSRTAFLQRTILHHDGYVMLNDGSEAGKAKRARNASLLRAELAKEPDSLKRLLQYLESGWGAEDYYSTLRHAVALVVKHTKDWELYGPAILRHAVYDAYNDKLPEYSDWAKRTRTLFPESYFTLIDVSFLQFLDAFAKSDYQTAIPYGEAYLAAYEVFQKDKNGLAATASSPLYRNTDYWALYIRLRLACACGLGGQPERAAELLKHTDWTVMKAEDTTYFIHMIEGLASKGVDVAPLLSACWAGIRQPVPSAERANERMAAFRTLVAVEDAEPDPDAELRRLAAKVKAILEQYPADDPAVADLKRSAAYRKVAYLIEGGSV